MGTFRIPLSARCTPTVRFCACRHNTALRDKCLYRKNGQLWRVETGRFDQQMSAGFCRPLRFADAVVAASIECRFDRSMRRCADAGLRGCVDRGRDQAPPNGGLKVMWRSGPFALSPVRCVMFIWLCGDR
jgi:hypothetical protein